MPALKAQRGAAWIDRIFTDSAIGRRGGPVRRATSSILFHTSLEAVFAEASARGWIVEHVDGYWTFRDGSKRAGRVVDVIGGRPILHIP